MDALALLSLFDERWVFGYQFQQRLIVAPFVLNLIYFSVCYLNVDSSFVNGINSSYFKGLLIVLITSQIVHFLNLNLKKKKIIKKMTGIEQNRQKILHYLYRLEIKKTLWDQFTFIAFGTSVVATCYAIYFLVSATTNRNLVSIVWVYVNGACLVYIFGFFLFFLVRKLSYLLRAWRFPKAYLKAQNIIN